MALQRLDTIGITVDDLDTVIAFFEEVGMELEGRADIEGEWSAPVVGLDDQRLSMAMMRTPDARPSTEAGGLKQVHR